MSVLLACCLCLTTTLENTSPVLIIFKGDKPIGAAVVVDARGYAITCMHVVGRRNKVTVGFIDGSYLDAKVVAFQLEDDLALLKIDSDLWRYVPVSLATDLPKPRQSILALGHPKGNIYSISSGIISALNREVLLSDGEPLKGLLQIDAAVNPGNSGGAVLNQRGELLGISVAMADGTQGVSYAIAVKAIRRMLVKHLPALTAQ